MKAKNDKSARLGKEGKSASVPAKKSVKSVKAVGRAAKADVPATAKGEKGDGKSLPVGAKEVKASGTAGKKTKTARGEAAKRVTVKKKVSAGPDKVTATTIIAMIDVGFGNQLYIRGEGPGMSWGAGIAMRCKGSDCWKWTAENVTEPFLFKVLVNDQVWSTGENIVAKPGESTLISPGF